MLSREEGVGKESGRKQASEQQYMIEWSALASKAKTRVRVFLTDLNAKFCDSFVL